MRYPRDMRGYGRTPPDAKWPGGAYVAVQFVLNYEEGGENNILHGDAASEAFLADVIGAAPWPGLRHWNVESMYEYGSRAGAWRILDLFQARDLPLTAFAVGLALELNPDLGRALSAAGHEVAGHGYRWIDYRTVPEAEERRHIRLTIEAIERICGVRPAGWYTGRVSQNTRRLLRVEGGFLYLSDTYNDDLPYWLADPPPQLVIPYTLVTNDARYLMSNGFASGADFFALLKDAFDLLWQEGERRPKMMSIGLHGRISGHPARAMALARFLDYVQGHDAVWVCRRVDIARHWMAVHPAPQP